MGKIGAAVWATGHAGRVIVEAGLTRPWLEFRGGIVYDPAKDGLDLGRGMRARRPARGAGLDRRRCRPRSSRHRRRLLHGDRLPDEVADACLRANRAGKDAITISGLVHPKTVLGATAAAELDAGAQGRRRPDPRHRALGLPDDHAATRVAFQRPPLRRDPTGAGRRHVAVGPRHPARRRDRRPDRGSRWRLHDAQLPRRGADAAGRVGRARRGRADLREHPRPDRVRRERNGYVAEPGTIGGHDRRAAANIRGGGRLVSVWRGLFDLSRSATAWRASAGSSSTATRRSRRPSGATSSSIPTRRPGRGRWPRCVRSGSCHRGCTRSTSWPSDRSSARPAGGPASAAVSPSSSTTSPRSASAVDERPRSERRLRWMDAGRPALRHEVRRDRRDGAGDGEPTPTARPARPRSRTSSAIGRPSRRPSTRTCLTFALRSVRADAAPADVGRREPIAARSPRPSKANGSSPIEPEFEQHADPGRSRPPGSRP